jgi:hypothetical protein
MNLDEMMSKANAEYGFSGGSDKYFKFVEGDNRLRVMSLPEPIGEHYKPGSANNGICIGKPECPGCREADAEPDPTKKNKVNVKFMMWVLDLKDGELKTAKFPYKIMQALQALQNNPEWAYSSMPMPYNVTINAKGAGKTDVVYTVMPGKETPIDQKVMDEFAKKTPPAEIKEKMKQKRLRELGIVEKAPGAMIANADDKGYDYPESEGEPAF